MIGFYVLWQWFSTMYLRHHWRIDLLGGLVYSAFAFSLFFRSLGRIDKAYAYGVSGGNGWQRLFKGTRLQFVFDHKPEKGYDIVMESSADESSVRSSVDDMVNRGRENDLESAWVEDWGATWETKNFSVKESAHS